MPNPYQVLGVSPLAGPEEIKSAYRKLAKTYHPDAGTDDPAHHNRFLEVTAAYKLLRRKAKSSEDDDRRGKKPIRKRPGKHSEKHSGKPRPKRQTQEKANKPEPHPSSFDEALAGVDPAKMESAPPPSWKKSPAFSDFLTNLKKASSRAFGSSGPDHTYQMSIPFLDAVSGTKRRLTLQNDRSLEVHIPPGVEDGQQIRLRGQGGSGLAGAEAGDAMVTISIAPHPVFQREGADIHVDVSVSLPEAVLGTKISVPTVDGDVAVTVPAGSNSGSILRLRGKGLSHPPGKRRLGRGDQYVRLALVLPPKPDDALKDFVATWAAGLTHKPRNS